MLETILALHIVNNHNQTRGSEWKRKPQAAAAFPTLRKAHHQNPLSGARLQPSERVSVAMNFDARKSHVKRYDPSCFHSASKIQGQDSVGYSVLFHQFPPGRIRFARMHRHFILTCNRGTRLFLLATDPPNTSRQLVLTGVRALLGKRDAGELGNSRIILR
jgi:hypothetical protein